MATKRQLINEKKVRKLDEKLVEATLTNKSNGAQPKQKRTRRFCLTSYIDDNALYGYLSNSKWIQHWAYIVHDKDIKEDGSPKEEHKHILLYTYEAKTATAIKKNFDNFSAEWYGARNLEAQNTLVQDCHDVVIQWRYLRHLDDKEKAQYSLDSVVCDDLSYWNTLDTHNGLTDCASNTGLSILEDYLGGTDVYTMAQRYGKEWIYHMTHYQNCARQLFLEQSKQTFGGLLDICQFALADSTYTEQQLTLFFSMLSYVQTKMDSKTDYILETNRYLKG